MKNTLKAALVILASAALTLSAKPEIKLIHSGIVCDTVVDALSPNGMAVNDRGEYLLTFQDQGDNSPSAHSYLTISKDFGRTWSKPEIFLTPDHGKQGKAGTICNIPGSTRMLMIVSKIDYDSDSLDPYAWKSRLGTTELYTTTTGKDLTYLTTLKQPKNAMVATMGYLTRLANGDLVLPAYIYSYGFPEEENAVYGSGWYRSTDNGKTWGDFELVFKDEKIDGRFKEAYNESAFAVRDDGIITGFARTDRNEPRRQFMVLSNDNGKTWSRPIPSGRLSVYIPLIVKLADHEGHLMVGGWREAYNNCVSMLHSTDGIAWELIGQAFYQPDNSHKPMNKATGGVQAMVPGPEKHQYYVVFYTHDPKLPGRHKTRLEGNMFEFVPDKQK